MIDLGFLGLKQGRGGLAKINVKSAVRVGARISIAYFSRVFYEN
jgi:hypothetical protein